MQAPSSISVRRLWPWSLGDSCTGDRPEAFFTDMPRSLPPLHRPRWVWRRSCRHLDHGILHGLILPRAGISSSTCRPLSPIPPLKQVFARLVDWIGVAAPRAWYVWLSAAAFASHACEPGRRQLRQAVREKEDPAETSPEGWLPGRGRYD